MTELSITPKQRKAIKHIEEALSKKFLGKTFSDAKQFISENLENALKIDIREKRKPTEKQLKGINFIQSFLQVEFTGTSMKDAGEFLDAYMDKAISLSKQSKHHYKGLC